MNKLFLVLLFSFIASVTMAQEEDEGRNFHRISATLGHTIVPQSIDYDGRRTWAAIASWAIDYDFWFNRTWAIGFHNVVVLESFIVNDYDDNDPQGRKYPITNCLVGIYKPGKRISLLLGTGVEYDDAENFFLIRAGMGYDWDMPRNWQIGLSINNDFKWEHYNSMAYGVAFRKKLFCKQ